MKQYNSVIADLENEQPQSIPDCWARVIHFTRRDTRDYNPTTKFPVTKYNAATSMSKENGIRQLQVSDKEALSAAAFDIGSDIISCSINKSKGASNGSFSMTLSSGDINYHHALHPGDHIFIWMRRTGHDKLIKHDSLLGENLCNNKIDSGLKLYGIITDVRRSFVTHANGSKTLRYRISGQDFGYFLNSNVYYQPTLAEPYNNPNTVLLLLYKTIKGMFSEFLKPNHILDLILDLYIGAGLPDIIKKAGIEVTGRLVTPNNLISVPHWVTDILKTGHTGNLLATVINRRLFIEEYKNSLDPDPIDELRGALMFNFDIGTDQSIWTVLRSYSNALMNEMFIDLQPTKMPSLNNEYRLMPTITCRQLPYTTSRGKVLFMKAKNLASTSFIELPRLRIPESFILSEDIGRSDSERFNFIELFGSIGNESDYAPIAQQTTMGNYAIDNESIRRYGLKTQIATTNCHLNIAKPGSKSKFDQQGIATMIPLWINMWSDWWLGAHVFESGTFELVGIEEPITLGNNIEIIRKNGISELYHIEGYSHRYDASLDGTKMFRTSVSVIRGQRIDEHPLYSEERLSEQTKLDIGLSDTEFDGMARTANSTNDPQSAISAIETVSPDNSSKPNGEDTRG